MAGPLRDAVEAIEDPNEYDSADTSPNWASTLAAYDQQVYAAVRAEPSLAQVPVIGPSLVNPGSYSTLGDHSRCLDYGNIHPYTAGAPSTAFIDNALATESLVAGTKPVMVTEFGYNNALNAQSGDPPVSDTAAAIYMLRTYLLNYMAGVPRSYVYELVDEKPDPGLTDQEEHFGLMNNDLTPKPAFTALENLLAVIGSPSAPASLTPLGLDLSSQATDIQSLLLEDDATYYQLILWHDESVWDSQTHEDLAVPSVPVTVTAPAVTTAAVARPMTSSTTSPLAVSDGSFEVSVPADPVVVSLTLGSQNAADPAGTDSGATNAAPSSSRTQPFLTQALARRWVRAALQHRFGRVFALRSHYEVSCERQATSRMLCKVAWRSGRRRYSGTVTIFYVATGPGAKWELRVLVGRVASEAQQSQPRAGRAKATAVP